jgi:hypothetical protein
MLLRTLHYGRSDTLEAALEMFVCEPRVQAVGGRSEPA